MHSPSHFCAYLVARFKVVDDVPVFEWVKICSEEQPTRIGVYVDSVLARVEHRPSYQQAYDELMANLRLRPDLRWALVQLKAAEMRSRRNRR